MRQLSLFAEAPPYQLVGDHLAVDDAILAMVRAHRPVAFSISGGKDGNGVAAAGNAWLDSVGHAGPRLLVHADLGSVEWRDSQRICAELAERLGLELLVVRRAAGGLMERWRSRWAANVERYASLSTVRLILPWSTASMRFCTSELKATIISRALSERWPGQQIVSALGLRREESPGRAKKPVSKADPNLAFASRETAGRVWLPGLDWALGDVWDIHRRYQLPIHPAYTEFKTSRVSCAFCILGAQEDLRRAALDPHNHATYRDQVDLELASTFSFQSDQWLCDVAPHLLTPAQQARVAPARRGAAARERAEAEIPPHLLYDKKGWPTCVPSWSEAQTLAAVRQAVAGAVGIEVGYLTPESIIERFSELYAQRKKAA